MLQFINCFLCFGWVPPIIIGHIDQTIVDYSFPIVITCVLNWSKGNWLLNDALNSAITMSSKLKEKVGIWQTLD
jgi:hypothetical protein